MSSEQFQTSRQQTISETVASIQRSMLALASDHGDNARALWALVLHVQEEANRGPATRPQGRWLDDSSSGHTRLAGAQARMFITVASSKSIDFADLYTKSSVSEVDGFDTVDQAMIFLEAFKRFLDKPTADTQLDGQDELFTLRRHHAGHVFARSVLCDGGYDKLATTCKLPNPRVSTNNLTISNRDASRLRRHSIDSWLAAYAKRLRDAGLPYSKVGSVLSISPQNASIYANSDPGIVSENDGEPRSAGTHPTETASTQPDDAPIRRLPDGQWQLTIDGQRRTLSETTVRAALVSYVL